MQSCAVALGKYNIRANAVLPGTIATDINKEDLSDDVKREGMIKRTCLGRLGRKCTIRKSRYTDTYFIKCAQSLTTSQALSSFSGATLPSM